jgi:prepilin-type N-terminal cleavage/methylation domain-containing protein
MRSATRAATRPGRRRRAGVSLLELMIVLVLLGAVLAFSGGVLLSMQRQTADGLARQEAVARARRATQALVAELRDLHFTPADLEPDAPFACSDLQYRIAVDRAGGTTVCDPTAASGQFRRIRLNGRRLERILPTGTTTVLAEVDGLSITLVPPDRLAIQVTVQRPGPDGPIFGIDAVTVLLRNR